MAVVFGASYRGKVTDIYWNIE